MQIPNAFFWLKFNQGLIHSGRIYKCKRLEVSSCFPQVVEKKSTFQRLATCLRIDTICALFPSLSTPIIQPIHYQGMYTLNSRRFVTEPTVRPPARRTNKSKQSCRNHLRDLFFPHLTTPYLSPVMYYLLFATLRPFPLPPLYCNKPPILIPTPNQPTNQPTPTWEEEGKGEKENNNEFVLPLEPTIPRPELDEPPGAEGVAGAQQGRGVDVEGAVGLGRREQHADGADALEDAVGGGPGALAAASRPAVQEVEADLARLERHVGVHHGGREGDPRRLEGVRRRDGDAEEPATFCFPAGRREGVSQSE